MREKALPSSVKNSTHKLRKDKTSLVEHFSRSPPASPAYDSGPTAHSDVHMTSGPRIHESPDENLGRGQTEQDSAAGRSPRDYQPKRARQVDLVIDEPFARKWPGGAHQFGFDGASPQY